MSSTATIWPVDLLDRMERAVTKVRERLLRATGSLEGAGIPYAVAGGHAVATWVATIDEGATRNTPDIDILLDRADLELAKTALAEVGFVYRQEVGMDLFLDGQNCPVRQAIHILFAGERSSE